MESQETRDIVCKNNNILQKLEVLQLIKIIRKYFINIYRYIHFIDQSEGNSFKTRNQYYYEKKHESQCSKEHKEGCCSSFNSKIYIPYDKRTNMEQVCGEVFDKHKFVQHLPDLFEFCQKKYYNIKQGGIKDGLKWDVETEQYILNQVMKEGCQLYFVTKIKEHSQKEQKINCVQPMLLATPQSWEKQFPKKQLNFLPGDALKHLHENHYCVIDNYMSEIPDFNQKLIYELEYLDKDGRYNDPTLQEQSMRSDRNIWFSLKDVDKNHFNGIYSIAEKLVSTPYELNKKDMGYYCQSSETFQICYFDEKESFHKKHLDSHQDKDKDTGRTLGVMFFCNKDLRAGDDNKKGVVRLYKSKENLDEYVDIYQKYNSMLIYKCRLLPLEILPNSSRRFIVKYWVNGPRDVKFGLF